MTAAFRGNKQKSTMGTYQRSSEEDEALYWCIANNVCISPRQIKWGEGKWVLDIETGIYPNRKLLGTSEAFGPVEIWQKQCEYAKYYYDKYKN